MDHMVLKNKITPKVSCLAGYSIVFAVVFNKLSEDWNSICRVVILARGS